MPKNCKKTNKKNNRMTACLSIFIYLFIHLSICIPTLETIHSDLPIRNRPFLTGWYFRKEEIMCGRYREEWNERANRVTVADLPCWIFPWEPQSIQSWAGQKKENEKIESEESGGQRFSFVSRDEMEFWCISQNPFILLGTTASSV